MKNFRSYSSRETKLFGSKLAKRLAKGKWPVTNGKNAVVFALRGELGSGKTTFVQGFFRGLGLKKGAASPTFIIMRRSSLRGGKFKNVFHVDAYRLKKAADLASLGFKDISSDPQNIILVEWAENVRKILPKNAIWLMFQHRKKPNERIIIKR